MAIVERGRNVPTGAKFAAAGRAVRSVSIGTPAVKHAFNTGTAGAAARRATIVPTVRVNINANLVNTARGKIAHRYATAARIAR